MAEINKPDLTHIWANNGDVRVPTDLKIDQGWTSEIPPFQWENYAQNRQDEGLVHLFQKGISVWSPNDTYYVTTNGTTAYVQGADGLIYVAKQTNTNQNPITDTAGTYWKVSFSYADGEFSLDSGTANNYITSHSPIIKNFKDGLTVSFKALNSNTGASTLKVDSLAAKPLVGQGLQPLQGNEVLSGEYVKAVYSSVHDSWAVITNIGGGFPVTAPTRSNHAATLGSVQNLISSARAAVYVNTAMVISPGTYLVDTTAGGFTLTLPSNPNYGDTFTFIDANNTWGLNNWILDPLTKTFEGSPGTLTVDVADQQWSLWYNSTRWEFV